MVIVATRGRPREARGLIDDLRLQTLPPALIIVVGAEADDLPPIFKEDGPVICLTSAPPGSTRQRNAGLKCFWESDVSRETDSFITFFDDDFRPASDWLEQAAVAFSENPKLAALTGHVLADGINGDPLSEEQAADHLSGALEARPHWSYVSRPKQVESLYGCNMAVRATVARDCAFDEELPLYGWQEDCDFSGQVRRLGLVELHPHCRGVHLGSRAARTSGLRMGYSQIANPIRIALRGNMSWLRLLRFISRALAANVLKSFQRSRRVDYPGRLQGNALAVLDLLRGRCRPTRILELGVK